MKLTTINKTRYRKHLNIVIISFIASFALLSLGLGQLLIALFSTPDGDNFMLNLFGVIISLLVVAAVLTKLKRTDYFYEIYYVWQLKQLQNKVYRKLKKIKAPAQENNLDALTILYFYYQSLRDVYQLDDNTITLSKVNQEISSLEAQLSSLNIAPETLVFEATLIDKF